LAAPFVIVEEAPAFGFADGLVRATVCAYRTLPNDDGATVSTDLVVTAHLRCTLAGAVALRNALNDALLLAAPAGGGKN
jgi:hypothetical protein